MKITSLIPILLCSFGSLSARQVPGSASQAPASSTEEALMLRLRDGTIHFGRIAEHDPDGLRFTLLSHGGSVRVPWSLLDPQQDLELRTRFGYVDVASEEYLVPATRFILRDGKELIGVNVTADPGSDLFQIKVDGNLVALPKNRVQRLESGVMVPALDVYSREEAYEKLSTGVDREDPQALWKLASDCERILDFGHAAGHYRELAALDPQFQTEAVQAKLAAAERKAEQQEQIDYLREIDKLRKKGYFSRALAMCDDFAHLFPRSPLSEDVGKKKLAVQLARDKKLTEEVRREWFRWMGRLAREAAVKETF